MEKAMHGHKQARKMCGEIGQTMAQNKYETS